MYSIPYLYFIIQGSWGKWEAGYWPICLLQPFFDGVKRGYRNGVDHRHFLAVVLVDDYHIKVLQVKLDPLKVNQLHLIQCHHKRGLCWEGAGSLYKYFPQAPAFSNLSHYAKDNKTIWGIFGKD